MKIGNAAKMTGLSVQAIRYYEKEQLLESAGRSEGNFRVYDHRAIEQLKFIKQCRNLDLSLNDIRKLIRFNNTPGTQCDDINKMIDAHIEQVELRMTELNALQRHLKSLRFSCSNNRPIEQCGILQNLSLSTT